ncbi:MAG TPA: DUF748 domain-containing protein, partial [Pseudomonadales bacterium]
MMHNKKPSPGSRLRRRALYTLLTIAVLLTLLPPGLRIGGEYALKQLGAEAARIDDIDLNLFSGRLAVHGLQLDYAGQPTLRLDTLELNLQMLALLQQRMLLQQLRVSGLDVQVFQQDETWVAGLPLPPAAADAPAEDTAVQASAWQFGIQQLQLQDLAVTVRYQGAEHLLQLDDLRLNPLLMWAPEDSSALAVNARINQAPMTLTADIKPFAETLAVALHISLADLQLAALQDVLPPETIQQLAARLSMDSDIRLALHSNGDMHIDQHGDISVALDQLAINDASLSADAMRWQGRVKVAIAAGQPPQLHAAGEASLAGLAASYLPLALSTALTQLSWQGEANVDLADTDNSLTAGGRLQLDNWQLQDQQQQGNLLQFDALALDDMRINGLADISLASVALTGLQALQHGDAALAGINTITLADIRLQDQQQLAIADLAIDTLSADLLRNANGNIEVLDDWQASLQQRLDARQA